MEETHEINLKERVNLKKEIQFNDGNPLEQCYENEHDLSIINVNIKLYDKDIVLDYYKDKLGDALRTIDYIEKGADEEKSMLKRDYINNMFEFSEVVTELLQHITDTLTKEECEKLKLSPHRPHGIGKKINKYINSAKKEKMWLDKKD